MKVVAADGSTWRVRRRWLPWRRQVRDVPDTPLDIGALWDDPISVVLMVIGLVLLLPALIVLAHQGRLRRTERVRGWSNAGRRMDDIATALRLGHAIPRRGEAAA